MKSTGNRVLLLSVTAFVLFSAVAGFGLLRGFDLWLVKLAQTRPSETLDDIGRVFSWFGDLEVVGTALLVLCAGLFVGGRRRPAWRLLAVFAATGLLEFGLKFVLPVPPLPDEVGRTTDPSPIVEVDYPYPYPSGHMLRSVILLGAIFVLWPNRLARVPILVFLGAMAATRVYLGVHWLSDLIGGALLATAGLAWVFEERSAFGDRPPARK